MEDGGKQNSNGLLVPENFRATGFNFTKQNKKLTL
jgi:hypothetical protein